MFLAHYSLILKWLIKCNTAHEIKIQLSGLAQFLLEVSAILHLSDCATGCSTTPDRDRSVKIRKVSSSPGN
jgi:hypothetical protein